MSARRERQERDDKAFYITRKIPEQYRNNFRNRPKDVPGTFLRKVPRTFLEQKMPFSPLLLACFAAFLGPKAPFMAILVLVRRKIGSNFDLA